MHGSEQRSRGAANYVGAHFFYVNVHLDTDAVSRLTLQSVIVALLLMFLNSRHPRKALSMPLVVRRTHG